MAVIAHLLALIRALAIDRSMLALENIALRQQILVLKRTVTRPRINDSDRTFWILMHRLLRDWKNAIFIVKPATVVRWHRHVTGGGNPQFVGVVSWRRYGSRHQVAGAQTSRRGHTRSSTKHSGVPSCRWEAA
jgi:hypothetical protein